jgi:hypothetical protein
MVSHVRVKGRKERKDTELTAQCLFVSIKNINEVSS